MPRSECVAVATLEEAREACLTPERKAPVRDLMAALEISLTVNDSGGTITRPDGTTITVAPTTYAELKREAGIGIGRYGSTNDPMVVMSGGAVIAAWNAKQASA